MSLHYASNVRGAGPSGSRQGNLTDAEWHQMATADTGTSHSLPGRLYVVQCEWCPAAFAAHTKAEAMSLFRHHETERAGASQ